MSIWIDAGHGGKDPGAVGKGFREKDQTLAVALLLQKACIEKGRRAYLTRSDDRFLSLQSRIANLQKNDIFISIHFNACLSHQGEGFEVYAPKNAQLDTKKLQEDVHTNIAALNKKYKIKDRGKKFANFYVLYNAVCRAVLIEVLFIDNPYDIKKIAGTNYYRELAAAIANAI